MEEYLGDKMKYKKKKKYHKSFYLIIGIFIYVLSLSIGYAYFTDSLKINGVASTVDYYSSTMLSTSPIIQDAVNNRYTVSNMEINGLDFVDEYWIGDTCYLKYIKRPNLNMTSKAIVTYTITFSNPTAVDYTNGKVTTAMIKNTNKQMSNKDATLDKTILAPGEVATVSFRTFFTFTDALQQNSAKAIVTYDVQGSTKYFYFIVDYALN